MKSGPLMIDIEGTSLTEADAELIAHEAVGGVILFSRNYESRAQLTSLCQSIRDCSKAPRLIAVDQEGGRVQRFIEEFVRLPALAKIDGFAKKYQLNAEMLANELAWLMACELISVGVDLSFAPVLDLDKGMSSVIGDRAFHQDVDRVVQLAKAYVDGMQEAGMKATGKHFPGHGSVSADSHHDLPIDNRSLETVLVDDGLVFSELIDYEIDALMMAHIQYPKFDEKPVGFSEKWIKSILRTRLGFGGMVFSDDLTMQGAESVGDYSARVDMALSAGCDMLLICNNREAVEAVIADESLELEDYQSDKIGRMLAEPKIIDQSRFSRVKELIEKMHQEPD